MARKEKKLEVEVIISENKQDLVGFVERVLELDKKDSESENQNKKQ